LIKILLIISVPAVGVLRKVGEGNISDMDTDDIVIPKLIVKRMRGY
jgi:hypothetical protein